MNNIVASGMIFFTGLLIGVGTGVLLAPHSGARTRRRLRDLGEELGDRAREVVTGANKVLGLTVERGSRLIA